MRSGTALGTLAFVLLAGMPAPVAAQDDATAEPAPVPAPAPPPMVPPPPAILLPPAPPLVPVAPRASISGQAVGIQAAEVAPANWTPAPTQAPPRTVPLKGKERKQYREERDNNRQRCLVKTDLTPRLGQRVVEACDWLLSQPPDPDDPADYRARLLQFRALGLVNQGGYEMALAALDEADGIGAAQADPLFGSGLGIGNDLIRAFILGKQARNDDAIALLKEIRARRPYSPSIVRAADAIEAGQVGKLDAYAAMLAARHRLEPDMARPLLDIYLMLGQLEQADEFGDRISLIDPEMRGGWRIVGDDDPIADLERAITIAGTRAYVAGALGDQTKAERLLAGARQAVADYVGTDPRGAAGRPKKTAIERYDQRKAAASRLLAPIDEWAAIILLRRDFEIGVALEIPDRLERFRGGATLFPAMVELLGRYEEREMRETGGPGGASIVEQLRNTMFTREIGVSAGELGKILPSPEYLTLIPKFKSNASWFWGGTMGYNQDKEGAGEIRTVRFEAMSSTPAIVEEMLLLAIANYARTEGKDAFVLLSTRTISRSITTSGWLGSYTSDAGFEAQARVLLVDTANPPPDLAGQAGRIVTVAEIEREIGPRYQAYEARRTAGKDRR